MLLMILSRFFSSARNAELQMETLNIMAKYQVVFTKLEAAVKKLCFIRKTRERLSLKTFFRKFRENCSATSKEIMAVPAVKRLKAAILTIIRLHKKSRISILRKYMLKFQLMAEVKRYAEVSEQRIKESNKQGNKDKEIASLKQWVKQKAKEVENLKKLQESLKERLRQDRGMSNDPKIASPRSTKHSKDHVKALKARIRELEGDNKVLRQEWEETESSVESFIQEVTEMIESQEFARTFYEIIELKLETEDKETDTDIGGSNIKPELNKKSPQVMTARVKPASKFNKKYKFL
jgi:cell division protein FtsB